MRRRRKRKRRTNYRPRKRRRRGSAGAVALRMVKQIRKNIETKEYRMGSSTHTLTAGGVTPSSTNTHSMTNSNATATALIQGLTKNDREGNKVTLKSIAARFVLDMAPNAQSYSQVRLCLILDRRPNGAQAGWTDVFQSTSITSLLQTDEDTKGRFQIMYDKTFNWEDGANNSKRLVKYYKRLNKPILWNGTGSNPAIGDLQRNNFFWIACVDGDGTVSGEIFARFEFRITYTDE